MLQNKAKSAVWGPDFLFHNFCLVCGVFEKNPQTIPGTVCLCVFVLWLSSFFASQQGKLKSEKDLIRFKNQVCGHVRRAILSVPPSAPINHDKRVSLKTSPMQAVLVFKHVTKIATHPKPLYENEVVSNLLQLNIHNRSIACMMFLVG